MKIIFLFLISISTFAQSFSSVYQEFENANYEEVIELLNSPVFLHHQDKRYPGIRSYLLGVSYARLQDFEKAIDTFNLALKNGNKSKEIFYELGQANYAVNNLDESIKNFKISIKHNYKVEQSTYYIGYIYQLREEHRNAKKYYQMLLKNKETSIEMRQIAYFQSALMNLEIARETKRTQDIVERYILPDLYKAIDLNPNSSTADDIEKRIKEIKAEFNLEEDKLINGAPLPSEKIKLSIDEKIVYDNNVTLSDDLPSSTGTNKDSFYSQTRFNISKAKNFKRRYTLTTNLEVRNMKYTDRNDPEIYQNDSYNITPELDFDFAYRYNKKAARAYFNYIYDYQARDINQAKETQFNYRSNQFELGTELPLFEVGNTSLTFKLQKYSYFTDTLERSTKILSIDQIFKKDYGLFIALYQMDMSEYTNNESQNTTSHLLRLDYIYPGIFPNTTLNVGVSNTFISYEDASQDATRGLESTLTFNTKVTRIINNHFSFGVEYAYSNNSSDEETSNYTAHQTSIEFSYNY